MAQLDDDAERIAITLGGITEWEAWDRALAAARSDAGLFGTGVVRITDGVAKHIPVAEWRGTAWPTITSDASASSSE